MRITYKHIPDIIINHETSLIDIDDEVLKRRVKEFFLMGYRRDEDIISKVDSIIEFMGNHIFQNKINSSTVKNEYSSSHFKSDEKMIQYILDEYREWRSYKKGESVSDKTDYIFKVK